MLDRRLADATARHVDDALRRDVVGGIHGEREVRHDVANFGTVEEARSAHDAIRHARAQQHVFEHAALSVRAIEDCYLVVAHAGTAAFFDLAGYPAALVALVACKVDFDLVAIFGVREQLLLLAVRIVRDDGVRRRQDIAHAAVVLFELHHVRVRVVLLEFQNVADVGPAP